MSNLFDFNSRADDALVGGQRSDTAFGFPQQRAGLRLTNGPVADGPLLRSRETAQAALQSLRPATPTAPPEPMLGYDPKTDTLFSGGKSFSAANLSEMDSYDKAGYFNIDNSSQLPPGMQAVPASKIKAWMQKEGANRGFGSAAAEFGQGLWSGLGEIPQMGVKAAAMAAPAGSWLERSLGDAAKTYAETANTPDTFGRGEVANTLIKGAYSAAPSVATGAAMLAAPVAGTAIAGSTMFGAEAWDTYERGLKEGLTPEAAKAAAYKTGAIEAVGELAGDAAGGVFLKGAGKVAMGLLKNGTVTHGKRVAVDLLANTGIQTGTEYAQGAAQTAVRNDAGFKYEDPHAVGMEGAQTGLGLSAILSPFGIAAGIANRPKVIPPAPTVTPVDRSNEPFVPVQEGPTGDMFGGRGELNMYPEAPVPQPVDNRGIDQGDMFASAPIPGMVETKPVDQRLPQGIMQDRPGVYTQAPAPAAEPAMGRTSVSMPAPGITTTGNGVYELAPSAPAQQPINVTTGLFGRDVPATQQALQTEEDPGYIAPTSTIPTSPSEGSPVAVAPSVTPAAPAAGAFSTRAELDVLAPTRAKAVEVAARNGVAAKASWSRTKILDAVMASKEKPAPKPTPVQPAEMAQSEEDELSRLLGDLEASVATQPAKVRGKITLPKQVLAGIMRAIKAPVTKSGAPATPRAYGEGSATPDAATEAKYMAQMTATRDAALKVIELAKQHYDQTSNRTPTDSKALLKKSPGETAETSGNAKANEVGAQTARDVREIQVRLASALKEFADAAGGMPNANALVAVLKARIQTISTKNVDKAKRETKVDTMLSRAWKEYVDGVLDDPENIAAVRSGEIRNSREVQKRGVETEPLERAATEGALGRPLFRKKGEEDAAYDKRKNAALEANKGIVGVLNYIQSHGTQFEAFLASAISRALKNGSTMPKLEFIAEGSPYYDPKKDTLYISKTASPEVALHEALHAALQWYVNAHPNHAAVKKLENALQTVLAYDRATLSPKAQEVYDVLSKLAKKSKRDAILELISYGSTLREFNVALTKMPSTDKGGFLGAVSDLWKRITSLVQNFLGVRDTVANDVLDATIKLLEEVATTDSARTVGTGSKLNLISTVTENFNRWFGNSKVVDSAGKPILLYTGTSKDADFSKFKIPKNGAWFTTDPESASQYAVENDSMDIKTTDYRTFTHVNTASRVMPVYVNISNPYTLTAEDMQAMRYASNYKAAQGRIFEKAKAAGHDGIDMGDGIWVVIKDPAQIKSATGNNGNFDPKDGNILFASVQSSTPESIATQPGGQPSVDLTRFSKNFMPNIVTEHVFKSMGWDKVPEWVTAKGEWLAGKIKANSPALSKYIGYVNANFNVPIPMREWFQRFKDEKHISGIVTDALVNKIASLPSSEVLDILKYLDGDTKALKNNAEARELADMVKEHRDEYIAGLRSEKAQRFFRDLKFTESMIFAKSTSEVVSGALGARKLNELAAQKHDTQLSDNVHAPLDARGDLVLDGKFYRLLQGNTMDAKGEPMVAGFVHESMRGNPPTGTTVEEDGLVWAHTGRGADKGTQKFTAYQDAAAAVVAGQANTVANALRNTMAILAANHASNNLTSAIASKAGDADMVVFDNVKDIGKATGVTPTPGSILHLSDPEAKSGKLQGIYRSRHQWVQIPKGGVHKQADGTEVPMGTYGALQGKLVRSDIWAAVQDMTDRRPLHDIAALHTTMRVFKKAKTVYNPGTHITNIASNLTLAMMHDIPMPTVAQATRLLFQYESNPNGMKPEERRVVHAFMNSGAMLGDFSSVEVKKSLYDAYKSAAATNEPTGVYGKVRGWASIELAKHETMSKWAKEAGKVDDRVTGMYAAEDNAFRLAAFLSKSGEIATRKGKTYLTPGEFKEAGDFARFAFLDYDIDSKAVKVLRQSVLPFVSWSYAIMPVLGHIALHKPWKLVNVLLAYSLLDMATGGDDDDEKRKAGPERFRSRMWGIGAHNYIRVPFMGDDENPVYFKMGAYVPTGNWLDKQPEGFLGINNWPQPVSPGGPFTNTILGLFGGIDPYTGKKLSTPAESDWEGLVDRAKFMGATFTPGWAPAAADIATKAAGGKGKPELGMAGNPVGNLDAARKFGGLQLDSFNTAEAKVQQNIAVKSIKADFDKEIAKLRRASDWEAFAKRRDELLQRRNDRINEAKGED